MARSVSNLIAFLPTAPAAGSNHSERASDRRFILTCLEPQPVLATLLHFHFIRIVQRIRIPGVGGLVA